MFTKEFEIVYLMLHGANHAWFRLKWLHDIYSYSKEPDVDWNRVIELSRHFGRKSLVYESLYLADKYWILPAKAAGLYQDDPKKLNSFALRYSNQLISEESRKSGFFAWFKYAYGFTRYGTTLFPGLSYKIAFLQILVYSDADMQMISLPDKLTFLYFIIRPFHVVYSKWRPYHLLYQKNK